MGPHPIVEQWLGFGLFGDTKRKASAADARKFIQEILSLGFNAGVKGVDVEIAARDITGISLHDNHIQLSTDDLEISFDLYDGNKLENFVLKG